MGSPAENRKVPTGSGFYSKRTPVHLRYKEEKMVKRRKKAVRKPKARKTKSRAKKPAKGRKKVARKAKKRTAKKRTTKRKTVRRRKPAAAASIMAVEQ